MKQSGRRAPRVPFLGEAIVYVGNEQLLCGGGNISVTGILLYPHALTPRAAQPREVMRLLFTLVDDRDWIDVDGVLVRQVQLESGFAWGVQFLQVPAEIESQLKSYLLRTPAGLAVPPRVSRTGAPQPEELGAPWPSLGRSTEPSLEDPSLTEEREILRLRPLDRDAVERMPPRR
jgi:hypothetical protein